MLILNKTIFVMMIAFILSVIIGFFYVPYMKKLKIKQNVSSFLPHHKKKNQTPTMGGGIFIIPTVVTVLVLGLLDMIDLNYNLWILMVVFLSYGFIGFIDDYTKVKMGNNKGISRKAKLIMQLFVAIVFFYIFMRNEAPPVLWIYTLGIKIHLGWTYGLFILFMLVGTSNAVNITDGLDGLAGGLSFIAFIAYGLIAWGAGWLEGYESIAMFCFALSGSLLGFLCYNSHPARIWMGDMGSLALGGALATVAILTRHELTLAIVGEYLLLKLYLR